MKVMMKNPARGELRTVKVGWSWILLLFSSFLGMLPFLRKLYLLGGLMRTTSDRRQSDGDQRPLPPHPSHFLRQAALAALTVFAIIFARAAHAQIPPEYHGVWAKDSRYCNPDIERQEGDNFPLLVVTKDGVDYMGEYCAYVAISKKENGKQKLVTTCIEDGESHNVIENWELYTPLVKIGEQRVRKQILRIGWENSVDWHRCPLESAGRIAHAEVTWELAPYYCKKPDNSEFEILQGDGVIKIRNEIHQTQWSSPENEKGCAKEGVRGIIPEYGEFHFCKYTKGGASLSLNDQLIAECNPDRNALKRYHNGKWRQN